MNLLTIVTVKLTSSITFKLISMAKNAAIVLLSVPLFHNPISSMQALGYSVQVRSPQLYPTLPYLVAGAA